MYTVKQMKVEIFYTPAFRIYIPRLSDYFTTTHILKVLLMLFITKSGITALLHRQLLYIWLKALFTFLIIVLFLNINW